jgi:pimeloyl-ACP methyl ester carboxylesterase
VAEPEEGLCEVVLHDTAGIRDLLIALGHGRATFVGHSLGRGVAMQLANSFPEHCERLVLVSSGGLGREISALLRAASLPGSELVLPLLVNDLVSWAWSGHPGHRQRR